MAIVRNVLAFILGLVIGSIVNGGLIQLGMIIIPPPAGADVMTEEGLKASMHLFGFQHFVFPFLAHTLGTLAGALVAALIAVSHRQLIAYAVGVLFFAGGTYMVMSLPSPMWFNVLDLVGAYLPMAWLGGVLARKIRA